MSLLGMCNWTLLSLVLKIWQEFDCIWEEFNYWKYAVKYPMLSSGDPHSSSTDILSDEEGTTRHNCPAKQMTAFRIQHKKWQAKMLTLIQIWEINIQLKINTNTFNPNPEPTRAGLFFIICHAPIWDRPGSAFQASHHIVNNRAASTASPYLVSPLLHNLCCDSTGTICIPNKRV